MKVKYVLERLYSDRLISEVEFNELSKRFDKKLFSLHWELKVILYLGVLLLSTGLGILIYLNIDTIGHTAIVSAIGLACLGCFGYSYNHRKPFSWKEIHSDHPFADYILLLGCLLFLTFEGYLQFQYNLFGNEYGLAALIPTILFFLVAYRFDHKGILSMGITGLGSWLGLTITPLHALEQDFSSLNLILTGLGLGIVLTAVSFLIIARDLKKHFSFSYFNFGMQLLFISTLSGMFSMDDWNFLFFILLGGWCYMAFSFAKREQSFYFLVLAVIYGYVGLTYMLFLLFDYMGAFASEGMVYLGLLYFILSCAGVIYFFFNYKKILNPTDAGL
ncbi:MAG: DUF2157 domain-containing protein [Cytophagales bacterium]|nr:DUF2157 domain-containing protein [Cytophagales bacterium]